jgi:hypothetical protein
VKLFLDDLRQPPDRTWTVARSFEAAKFLVSRFGVPAQISFDHDLGASNDGEPFKTGYDFAKWLIEEHLEGRIDISKTKITVHSANPVGRDNIEGLFASFERHRRKYGI